MSRGVNKVIIVGNCGQDPDVNTTNGGKCAVNISVATSESWTDKNTGERKEATEWHRIAFFNRVAEIARDYLKKGSKVYIEGSLKTRKWQDKDGNERYTTEIVARELQMLDSRSEGGQQNIQPQQNNGGYQQSNNGYQQNQYANQTQGMQQQNNSMNGQDGGPPF